MPNPFLRYLARITPKKPVSSIDVALVAEDFTGTVRATDIMLQGGDLLTGWAPNSQEMLVRPRDASGNIVPPKFFNALIRGSAIVIVPNTGGMVMTPTGNGGISIYNPTGKPATTGLDVEVSVERNTTGPIKLETYYQTREFTYNANLKAGDVLRIDSGSHKVSVNGNPVQPGPSTYQGAPLTCPYGDVLYRVTMHGRDAARFLFTVEEWNVAEGVTW